MILFIQTSYSINMFQSLNIFSQSNYFKNINIHMKLFTSSTHILSILLALQLIVDTLCQEEIIVHPHPTTYKYYIFTDQCFDTFFNNSDWTNFPCLKQTIAKLLGYCVVVGAAIVKLPQIIKIIQRKSVFGVSFTSVLFESSTQISAVAYNIYRSNPFSVYGETLLITLQMIVIHLLFAIFDGKKRTFYAFTLIPVLVIFWAAFHSEYFPQYVLENTITVQIILFSGARLSQIFQIHRVKSTGSLSIITCGLTVLGNIARLATALVEVKQDGKFLLSVVIALVLNTYILLSFLFFKDKHHHEVKQQKKQ